jgi:sugar lactone lactonase YvrE
VVLPGKAAYVANARSPEIYRLDLEREGTGLSLWKSVPDAVTFGPAVHDAKRGRLLVADPFVGRIYGRSTGGGRTELVLKNLGEVTALALDEARGRLYIADSAGRRILVAGLTEKAPVPRVFSKIAELDEPLGVAVAADGSLWVCDKSAGAIFLLSPDGALARTFELPR